MRIHANALTVRNVHAAALKAHVNVVKLDQFGSKSRDHAFEIGLSGSGAHRTQYTDLDYPAATWDEWGMFLAYLYRCDDSIVIPRAYSDESDFHWQTDGRFRKLWPADQHKLHRWTITRAGDGVSEAECKCGAVKRWTYRGLDRF